MNGLFDLLVTVGDPVPGARGAPRALRVLVKFHVRTKARVCDYHPLPRDGKFSFQN